MKVNASSKTNKNRTVLFQVPRSSLPPSGSTKFTRSMGLNGTPISQHLVDEGKSATA